MVQLVTRGILLDTMRVDTSDEEIEIRVRLPEADRVLSTLDSLRVRTTSGLVPLSNFITRTPVPELAQIDRIDQNRYFGVGFSDATRGRLCVAIHRLASEKRSSGKSRGCSWWVVCCYGDLVGGRALDKI